MGNLAVADGPLGRFGHFGRPSGRSLRFLFYRKMEKTADLIPNVSLFLIVIVYSNQPTCGKNVDDDGNGGNRSGERTLELSRDGGDFSVKTP